MAGTSSPERSWAPSTDGEIAAAWRDRHQPAARAALVDAYTPLVRSLASRAYARRSGTALQFADLVQQGMVGLLEAIDRFDPERGPRFESFALARIEGAMLDGLAVYSEVQQQLARRREIERRRAASLRQGENAGVGAGVGAGEADAEEAPRSALEQLAELAVGLAVGFLLEDAGADANAEPSMPDNAYARTEMKQMRQLLTELVQQLPRPEHRVLKRHYFQQQGFDEIAQGMGLTRGRISQLHRAGLQHLLRQLRARGFCSEG